jgi:hypothetical protein
MLASSTWSARQYRLRYAGASEVADYLESIPVELVALDTNESRPWAPHRRQLMEALRQRPDRWELLPLEAYRHSKLRVYWLTGHAGRPPGKIRVDLRN